jgi:hypothetical protein
LIHEDSPRPKEVFARYVGGVWPPGFKGGDRGGVTDFYGALWHYTVKGEDVPGGGTLEDNQYIATDTFTKLRRGIEKIVADGRVWNSVADRPYASMQELYNAANVFGYLWDDARQRGMTGSIGWNADLSRGVDVTLPDGATEDYGRTWVVAIEEILKCLEKLNVLVLSTINLEPTAHKFLQTSAIEDDADWQTVGGEAHAGRIAASWSGGGAWRFGIAANLSSSGGLYYCVEWCERLIIIADTKYREGYSVGGNMWLTFAGNIRPPGFKPFFAVVGLESNWDYGDSFDEDSGAGVVSDEILVLGDEGDTDTISFLLNSGIFENQLPMLFSVRHAWEWVQIYPPAIPPYTPPPDFDVYSQQAISITDQAKAYLVCEPTLTFIGAY